MAAAEVGQTAGQVGGPAGHSLRQYLGFQPQPRPEAPLGISAIWVRCVARLAARLLAQRCSPSLAMCFTSCLFSFSSVSPRLPDLRGKHLFVILTLHVASPLFQVRVFEFRGSWAQTRSSCVDSGGGE